MTKVKPYFFVLNFVAFLCLIGSIDLCAQCAQPDGTILVTNANAIGLGSLHNAIICANDIPGPNNIHFNIPGSGNHVIYVGNGTGDELPTLFDPYTVIDATTQPGFGQNGDFSPKIILDGSQNSWNIPINAIFIRASHCEIYGLEIRNFPDDGIDLYQASNSIVGNVGKGNIIYNTGSDQDYFSGLPNTGPWQGCGIVVRQNSSNCLIEGNIIGTDENLTPNIGIEFVGVLNYGNSHNTQIKNNTITSSEIGIRVDASISAMLSENSIYCNSNAGITLTNGGNYNKQPPFISTVTTINIAGTGASGDVAEVYLNNDVNCQGSPCQGKTLLGTAVVSNGQWSLSGPFLNGVALNGGEGITATLRDGTNNTTAFSACQYVPANSACVQFDGTILVTNTNDSGSGSLREAINCANSNLGPNTIKFAIPGNGKHYINVGITTGDELPALEDDFTIIDATTATDFGINGNYDPKIVLDGQYTNWNAPINAIWVRADYCEVYGLEIINFPDDGIDITASHDCKIGAPNKGNVIYNNGSVTDYFPLAPNTGPWEGCGIVLKLNSFDCTVQGNTIGTNYDHSIIGGNEYCGVIIENGGDNNLVGGSSNGEANHIANHLVGVSVYENSVQCEISENTFSCNSYFGIELRGNANDNQNIPNIANVDAQSISGSAVSGDQIEIYISDKSKCGTAACQGSVFLGTTTVPPSGQWTLNAPFANGFSLSTGDEVTATSTDSNGNTSEFSNCKLYTFNCLLTTSSSNFSNATCSQANGEVTFTAAGGSLPYSYTMGGVTNSTGVFTNLGVGSYNMTVTDVQGCTATESINVINSNGLPQLFIASFTHTTCGENNGTITMSTVGGNGAYTYNLGQGATTNPNFTNLSPGDYTISVIDGNGCQDTNTLTINVSSSIFTSLVNINPPTCNGSNGSLSVSATGGSGTYGFDIGNGSSPNNSFQNLAAGSYTITVTDSNGCIGTDQITMTSTAGPSAFISTGNATCGQANGVVDITASGGTTPYTYDIGFGASGNNSITGLSQGNYNVTITDAVGCQEVKPFTIIDNGPVTVTAINIVHEDCDGNTGSFSAQISGGTAPYFYSIGGGNTLNTNFTNLDPGTYTLSVTDGNDCTASTTVSIIPSDIPVVNVGGLNFANCGLSDGSFFATGFGGLPPYSFGIGNGLTSNNSFTGLPAGDYNVLMVDANGCTADALVTLGNADGPSAIVANMVDASCGMSDGNITLQTTGGTPPYTYDFGNGTTSSNSFTNLSAGNYIITVTDANTCETITTQEILTVGGSPIATFSQTVNGNAISFLTTSADVNSLTVNWDFGTGNTATIAHPTFNFPGTGTYMVCQTVTNACGSDTHCEEITVIGNDVFTMNIEEGEGEIGSIVSIPVTVENFDEIVGISHSYHVSDTNVARFVGTSGHNLSGLGGFSFNVTSTTLTLAWFDISIAGVTVPDNTVIFYIDVEILGNVGDCTSLIIDGNPTAEEVIKKSGNTEINVPSVMNGGNVCVTQNIEDLFTMTLLEADGPVGSIVSIPVTVKNFDDIVGVSNSFEIVDGTVAKFVGTSGYNLPDLGSYSFNLSNNNITISWFDLIVAGVTVPDDAVIFYLDVELLGNGGGCSNVLISGDPTAIEIIQKSGNTEIDIPYVVNSGSVCTLLPASSILIAGKIEKENAVAVQDVEMTCTGGYFDWSIPTGEFSFPEMIPSINYTIDPKKDTLYAAGVTTLDLVKIQEHVLNVNILDSPYKIIAADINKSNSISTLDLIFLQDVILSRSDTFPNNESWRFVPTSYVFTDPTNPFLDNFPEEISLNSPTMDEMNQDFVGIKIGDVNISSSAFMIGEVDRENIVLAIEDQAYRQGEEISISFTANQFEEIAGMQGDIIFDETILEFKEVVSGALPSFSNNNIGKKYLKNGVIPFSWFNPIYSEKGVTIYDNETLYIMKFRALQSGNTLNEVIQLGSVNTKLEIFKANYTVCDFTLEVKKGTVSVDDNPKNRSHQFKLCSPNPFSESTMIEFILSEQDRIALTIHDSNGVLIKELNRSFERGHHTLCITADDLPSFGIFYFRLSTSENEYAGKMVHLNRQ